MQRSDSRHFSAAPAKYLSAITPVYLPLRIQTVIMLRFYSLIGLLGFIVLMGACNKEDDESPCLPNLNYQEQLASQIAELARQGARYAQDPSTENCILLSDVYNNYIKAAEGLKGCAEASGQVTELQNSIDQAKEARADLPCT